MLYTDIFDYNSILFRGKSIVNNNWILGYFKQCNNKSYIEMDTDNKIEIIASTLGMFTGLLDFNNKQIFTGDVISNSRYMHKHLVIHTKNGFHTMSISDYEQMFKYNILLLSDVAILKNEWLQQCEKIIVGNIYDNPDIFSPVIFG